MNLIRALADRMTGGARLLIPAAKSDWARAMAAEQEAIAEDGDALAFAAGCLRAAGWARMRAAAPDGAWLWPGAAFGLLFLATALVPGSGSLPLLWAPLAGILAVLALEPSARPAGFVGAAAIASKAGALAGFLFFVGAVAVRFAGTEASAPPMTTLAVAGVALALVTTISGAAVAPLLQARGPSNLSTSKGEEKMSRASHPVRTAGLALGGLYLIEAVIATGLLFAVWPILGGIFAAALTRRDPATRLTAGTGAAAGAKAGVVGGLVLLLIGTPLTLWLLTKLGEKPGLFGVTFDLGPVPTMMIMFAIYAAFGILVAAAAGALTGLLAGRRTQD